MTKEEAFKTIDELGLEGKETHDGKEIKCYVRDLVDNGVNIRYLTAEDCGRLSYAFAFLAGALRERG